MSVATVGQAMATFAVTNIDDLVVLAVFFGQTHGHRTPATRVIAGQYLGFAATVAASIGAALLGAALLPTSVLPYLGLLPIMLGLKAAWEAWRRRHSDDPGQADGPSAPSGPGIWQVAGVTFANGGDNVGVYVPIFAVAPAGTVATYVAVFLVGVGVWCAAGRYLASHPIVAKTFSRWGHVILPVILISIGVSILVEGGVFAG